MDPGPRALIGAPLAALLLLACGNAGGGNTLPDADPFRPDATVPSCPEASAVIGRCQLADTGGDCTGAPDEQREFVALASGDQVPMVTGIQGARMFVLALRTGDIMPGDPVDPTSPTNPDVSITLVQAADPIAFYHGTPAFTAVIATPDTYEAVGLFVVLEGSGDELLGTTLEATAQLRDMNGELRCGRILFTAAP
jgi:hypothetical protein